MKKIVKEELNRAVKNKGMVLALTIGIVIAVSHVIQCIIPAYHANEMMEFEKFPTIYPLTVSDTWLAGNQVSLESFLYFLVLPIIAVLPFGTSYFADGQSGFLRGIYVRIPRKKYLQAKYIAAFISGGLAVVLPLLVNLMFALVLLPNMSAATILPCNRMEAVNLFYTIYDSYPLVYIFLFLCLDFIMGGIFACIGLACSYLSDYKIIVAICPFFIQLTVHIIFSMLMKMEYSSVFFLQSGYGISAPWVVLLYIVIGIGLSAAVFLKKGEKEDVF